MMKMRESSAHEASRWVFGYGSLIWNPGFAHLGAHPALLRGAHRSLCIYSHLHRGTPERPGLVFGLVPGGSTRGMAFEVAEADWATVRDYLREREQANNVYREAWRPVVLGTGRVVPALAFLVDLGHAQYAGRLPLETQRDLVRDAVGNAGPNVDYVRNTVQHLGRMGIRDRQLAMLAEWLNQPHPAEA